MAKQPPVDKRGVLEAGGRSLCLPGVLADIHRLLGLPITQRIIDHYGGGRMYIPTPDGVDDASELARLVGRPAALLLAHRLGGLDTLRLPNGSRELTWYWARIHYIAGHTVPEVRRILLRRHRIRVSDRHILDLVGDIRASARSPRPCPRPYHRRRAIKAQAPALPLFDGLVPRSPAG